MKPSLASLLFLAFLLPSAAFSAGDYVLPLVPGSVREGSEYPQGGGKRWVDAEVIVACDEALVELKAIEVPPVVRGKHIWEVIAYGKPTGRRCDGDPAVVKARTPIRPVYGAREYHAVQPAEDHSDPGAPTFDPLLRCRLEGKGSQAVSYDGELIARYDGRQRQLFLRVDGTGPESSLAETAVRWELTDGVLSIRRGKGSDPDAIIFLLFLASTTQDPQTGKELVLSSLALPGYLYGEWTHLGCELHPESE
jgi:hypothetical protein